MALTIPPYKVTLMCLALVVVCCSRPPPNPSTTTSNTVAGDGYSYTVAGGASPLLCHVGDFSREIPTLPMRDVLSDAEPYIGQRIRVRGYVRLVFEQMALIEPVRRQDTMLLDISNLPAKSGMDVKACDLKLVEVEGTLRRPGRPRNALLLIATAMSTPMPRRTTQH